MMLYKTDDARSDLLRCLRTAAPAGAAATVILFLFSTVPALSAKTNLCLAFFNGYNRTVGFTKTLAFIEKTASD